MDMSKFFLFFTKNLENFGGNVFFYCKFKSLDTQTGRLQVFFECQKLKKQPQNIQKKEDEW